MTTQATHDLTHRIVEFGRLLRSKGMRVTSAQIIDALHAVQAVQITDREDFRLALRATLPSDLDELPIFDEAFASYWEGVSQEELEQEAPAEDLQQGQSAELREQQAMGLPEGEPPTTTAETTGGGGASPLQIIIEKDFTSFRPDEMGEIARAIVLIAQKLAASYSRRMRVSSRGQAINLRRTMRRNLKYGGTVLEFVRSAPKIRKPRLVLICDVSRSMDQYSRFLLQFIYAFQHVLGRVESFVFSTQLTRVTDYFHTSDIYTALDRIAVEVPDWSGGTRIGKSLSAFNEQYGLSLVNKRTVVIILSDGLDTGDPQELERAIEWLHNRARKVIWLNPALGSQANRPRPRGIRAVMDHVHVMASAHNLASLQEIGKYIHA